MTLFLGKPLLCATSFKIELNRPYLAKGLLLASQVSILVGPPNTGKSSVVACLAASISMGRTIGHIRVKRGAVLYVAAEDPNGIAERSHGYFHTEPTDLAHFHIHGWPINLADDDEMATFCAEAQKFRRSFQAAQMLIVFDTLNLCIGDGDENSARDMSRVIENAQRLARATRAHVMIIGASDQRVRLRRDGRLIGSTGARQVSSVVFRCSRPAVEAVWRISGRLVLMPSTAVASGTGCRGRTR